MSDDKLVVQVAIKIKAKPNAKIKKKVLDEILQRLVNRRPLPKNVEVRGIFWRNPNRRGTGGHWRFHNGADLSVAPRPLHPDYPRGSLQDALDTLAPFLETGQVTF